MKLTFDSLQPGKKFYFASDFHLGSPNKEISRQREKKIIRWLEQIEKDAQAIFLVGDIFDFWYEYRWVVPKGYVRFLGKIAELKDKGIDIYFFVGNHDVWMFDYFPDEIGVPVIKENVQFEVNGVKFFVGHGDGYGPGDHFYKFLKKIFYNKVLQEVFKWLHPDIGNWFANKWSKHSRSSKKGKEDTFLGEKEYLIQYVRTVEKEEHHDYYLFGHRHLVIDTKVGDARYMNLGDWFEKCSYAEFDGEKVHYKYFQE